MADAGGRIIQSNASLTDWLGVEPGALRRIDDLPRFFEDPEHARFRLEALIGESKPWRGEAAIVSRGGGSIPVLVRADPVFVAGDRVSGFVLLLADLTDSKVAHSARRRFQEDILRNQRQFLTLAAGSDVAIQRLISSVIENAQLAALEITEGADVSEVPASLDAVGVSVARTVEVLEQLVRSSLVVRSTGE